VVRDQPPEAQQCAPGDDEIDHQNQHLVDHRSHGSSFCGALPLLDGGADRGNAR
jgi:hypothetical protein